MTFETSADGMPSLTTSKTLNQRTSRAVAMLLILVQVLILAILIRFPVGYFLTSLALGVATYYLWTSINIVTDRIEGAKNLLASDINYTDGSMFDDLPVPMVDITNEGKIIRANMAACHLLGRKSVEKQMLGDIVEGLGRSIRERTGDTMKGFSMGRPEMARCYRDGQEVFIQLTMSRMNHRGKTTVLAVLSDATELKTLEAQFVQSQKMQAVGQLAGGVAHDFNNILTAITGHADLLLHRTDTHDQDYDDLIQIKHNSNRAAALIRQLLAFSRKQTLQPKTLHLDDTMSELSHLLNRLLGEKVSLLTENAEDLRTVRADERQLEQVIVNLVVNARDAMPHGGTVLIKTRNLTLRKELRRDRATVHPGDYVVVEVSDTGTGIPEDKLSKIFEPFFTTKKVGEGTGLGLSTVYGIVKQTGGFVFVDSTVDAGTKFSIYLPAYEGADDEPEIVTSNPTSPKDQTGRGRILLVEDEAPVRAFAARALALRGYSVTQAESGEEALQILDDPDIEFDVFVTDVVMPGKDGPTWVREAILTRPNIDVIFVSGYAEEAFKEGNIDIPNASFLAKPFSLIELTEKVKAHVGS